MSSSTKNIITGVVGVVAVLLVVVVLLVMKFGTDEDRREKETIIVSEIISELRTDENGETFFYTMVTRYSKPKYSSGHTYPSTKKPTTTAPFVELTAYEYATDENGNPVYDENGQMMTEVVTYTVPAESYVAPTEPEPSTESVGVTDENGNAVLDENGNPVTEIVTLPPPETVTREDIWQSENNRPGVGILPTRDDALAENIVSQINRDRADRGLEPLTHDQDLKADARVQSTYKAAPDLANKEYNSGTTFETSYGGQSLYVTVMQSMGGRALNAETTRIGVGVVKLNGTYYTTVILA